MKDKIIKLYKQYEEIINYVIVGGLTTVIAIVVKLGLYYTILDVNNALQAQIGVVTSWIIAVIFAYITNRIFVFKSKDSSIFKEFISFIGSRLLTLGIESILTYLFFTVLGLTSSIGVFLVTIGIQVLVIVLNYVFSKLFVFKKGKD